MAASATVLLHVFRILQFKNRHARHGLRVPVLWGMERVLRLLALGLRAVVSLLPCSVQALSRLSLIGPGILGLKHHQGIRVPWSSHV